MTRSWELKGFFYPLDGERKRKRRSRWGTEEKKTFIPGMPTTMPPNLSPEQQQAYIGKGMMNDDILATDSPSFSLIALRRICFLAKTCLLLTLCFKVGCFSCVDFWDIQFKPCLHLQGFTTCWLRAKFTNRKRGDLWLYFGQGCFRLGKNYVIRSQL